MKDWFNGLEQREQRLVSVMFVTLFIAIVYFFLINPLQTRLDKAEKGVAREQKLLSWVEMNAATLVKLRGGAGVATNASGSLDQRINNSARKHNLTINRLQPQNNKMQVMIDKAPFNQILQWVQTLQLDYGLTVEIADFRQDNQQGFVKTRIVVSQ
jgi:general secretion pathway protein M